jgi:hypothetical protein
MFVFVRMIMRVVVVMIVGVSVGLAFRLCGGFLFLLGLALYFLVLFKISIDQTTSSFRDFLPLQSPANPKVA